MAVKVLLVLLPARTCPYLVLRYRVVDDDIRLPPASASTASRIFSTEARSPTSACAIIARSAHRADLLRHLFRLVLRRSVVVHADIRAALRQRPADHDVAEVFRCRP